MSTPSPYQNDPTVIDLIEDAQDAHVAIEDLEALKAKDPSTYRRTGGPETLRLARTVLEDATSRLDELGITLNLTDR